MVWRHDKEGPLHASSPAAVAGPWVFSSWASTNKSHCLLIGHSSARGPWCPQGSWDLAWMVGSSQAPAPSQAAGGKGSLPQRNSSIFGTQGISLLSGRGTRASLPKPLLRVSHPHHILGTILPGAIPPSPSLCLPPCTAVAFS